MNPVPSSEFYEVQWFARRWWWFLLATSALIITLEVKALLAKPSLMTALTLVLLTLPVLVILWVLKLTVRVDAVGIHYQFIPFLNRWRHWPWTEFRQVFPRTYSPLGDYGGWGLRGLPGNLAYNVWGTHGLQLVFGGGSRLLLGTQRPAELRAVLASLHAGDASRPIQL
ncbi:MAG: hypothetical protein EOO56_14285 [Hymenobacter sp.]|nr:MAG: hypothetical protein EOO56_14285 [Hymenobacter sp.]